MKLLLVMSTFMFSLAVFGTDFDIEYFLIEGSDHCPEVVLFDAEDFERNKSIIVERYYPGESSYDVFSNSYKKEKSKVEEVKVTSKSITKKIYQKKMFSKKVIHSLEIRVDDEYSLGDLVIIETNFNQINSAAKKCSYSNSHNTKEYL